MKRPEELLPDFKSGEDEELSDVVETLVDSSWDSVKVLEVEFEIKLEEVCSFLLFED